jgi:hypothetical protein
MSDFSSAGVFEAVPGTSLRHYRRKPQLLLTGRGTHPDGLKVKALVPIGLSVTRKLGIFLLCDH